MRILLLLAVACTVSCGESVSNASEPDADANKDAEVTFEDTDGDGLPDKVGANGETFVDSDGDGLPDQRKKESSESSDQ